jgi:hypothetical protein
VPPPEFELLAGNLVQVDRPGNGLSDGDFAAERRSGKGRFVYRIKPERLSAVECFRRGKTSASGNGENRNFRIFSEKFPQMRRNGEKTFGLDRCHQFILLP